MLYQTTFDTIPRFDTSMTLLSQIMYFLESIMLCTVKYNSTTESKIQVLRFGEGDENVNSIDNLYIYFIRRENGTNCQK